MTNVLRTYGKLPALFTFLGDFFKGVLAVGGRKADLFGHGRHRL